MKVYEIKKGEAEIQRGRVLMAIEGPESQIEAVEAKLVEADFDSTDCAEDGDKDGDMVIFFVVDRWDIKAFREEFKKAKKAA